MSGGTSVPVLPGQVFIMKGLRGAAVVLCAFLLGLGYSSFLGLVTAQLPPGAAIPSGKVFCLRPAEQDEGQGNT